MTAAIVGSLYDDVAACMQFQTLRHDALKQVEMLPAGFVIFSNLRSATIAAQVGRVERRVNSVNKISCA
jgi:hypothetical protein